MHRGKYVENGKIVFLTFNNVYDGRQKYVIQKDFSDSFLTNFEAFKLKLRL